MQTRLKVRFQTSWLNSKTWKISASSYFSSSVFFFFFFFFFSGVGKGGRDVSPVILPSYNYRIYHDSAFCKWASFEDLTHTHNDFWYFYSIKLYSTTCCKIIEMLHHQNTSYVFCYSTVLLHMSLHAINIIIKLMFSCFAINGPKVNLF